MPDTVEIPSTMRRKYHGRNPGTLPLVETVAGFLPGFTRELVYFKLPEAVEARLQHLLDRQDAGEALTPEEQGEAEGLVELTEFLSLLNLRSRRSPPSS